MRSPEDVIVTDIFYLPEDLGYAYFKKKMLFVKTGEELLEVQELLREKNVTSCLLILSYNLRFRLVDDSSLRHFLEKSNLISSEVIGTTALPRWAVQIGHFQSYPLKATGVIP